MVSLNVDNSRSSYDHSRTVATTPSLRTSSPKSAHGPLGNDGLSDEREWVSIKDLKPAYSPRAEGENSEHLRSMIESDTEMPAIIVQRSTSRVVDGMHRVRVAQSRGEHQIRCRYFDGDDESAFVLAVRLNVQHGLPLSLSDRKAAAKRILRAHSSWSDRAIAAASGLSHKTIAILRHESGHSVTQFRIGRDGYSRPLNAMCGRERARTILEENPNASLRQVGAAAGVSPGTVRNVRDRLRRQADVAVLMPVPAKSSLRLDPPGPAGETHLSSAGASSKETLRMLRADPSLRLTDSGRLLLSILSVASMDTDEYERLAASLPNHCIASVAGLASASVSAWKEIEALINRRSSK